MQERCVLIQNDVRISTTRDRWTDKHLWSRRSSLLICWFTICLFKQLLSTVSQSQAKWFPFSPPLLAPAVIILGEMSKLFPSI